MVRRAAVAGDARVYDISGRRVAPLEASLSVGLRATAAQKRARRKVELENTDTDLIQDFEFPTVSNRIKVSSDGRYLFASGTYPPQLHVYDTDELSLKFKRHVDSDIVEFQILEPDWKKFALLTADRYVDLHSPFGSHFRTRVPRYGRDLMLHRGTCDLFICGDGRDVWRLNLEQGQFMIPVATKSGLSGGNNVCGISPVNSLLLFGGESAVVDVWDSRCVGKSQSPAGVLDVITAMSSWDEMTRRLLTTGRRPEITALRFDETDGVSFTVGTSSGFSVLFDLRSPHPLLVRDQGNGLPVHSIRMHEDSKHCLSADAKSVKVWDRRTGENMVTIEPDANINHLCTIGNSGVMCTAMEAPRVKSYYVPALGPAPKWCSFLDTFTEELEDGRRKRVDRGKPGGEIGENEEGEDVEEVYENYKFVSQDQLEGLGLGHLVGTEMLKAYMHGYFVHQKLYQRAVEVSEPFAYDKYRKEKARERLEAQRESRISKQKSRKVKVNQKVVEAIRAKGAKGGKKGARSLSLLDDERFSAMFANEDFAVDEEAERYQHLNPSGDAPAAKSVISDDEENSDEEYLEQFELVDDEPGDINNKIDSGTGQVWSSDEDDEDEEEDDEDHKQAVAEKEVDDRDEHSISKLRRRERPQSSSDRKKAPRMFGLDKAAELRIGLSLKENGTNRKKLREEVSLGARVEAQSRNRGAQKDSVKVTPRGGGDQRRGRAFG